MQTTPDTKMQIISSIYFYFVLFTFIIIGFFSGLVLILSITLKEPTVTQTTSLFNLGSLTTETTKDAESFKSECKSQLGIYSSSYSSDTQKEEDDRKIDECANKKLTQYQNDKKKVEDDRKTVEKENNDRNITTSTTFLAGSLVAVVLHLISFKAFRKFFAR